MLSEILTQVPVMTTCGSLKEAQEPGTTRNLSCHLTFAALGVQPYVLQIASFSACSFSRACSESAFTHLEQEAEQRRRRAHHATASWEGSRDGSGTLLCAPGLVG